MGVEGFSLADWVGLACFVATWLVYHFLMEQTRAGSVSLNRLMNVHRYQWMRTTAARENRILDGNINSSLQNGTAFFASTSLIAVGGALTLLRQPDEVLTLFSHLPIGMPTSRIAWEMKVFGLVVIFVYAFFKFAWSYRLFNYAAVLIGAIPDRKDGDKERIEVATWRAASMGTVAGRHFNRGQRAFFFALAYLGWFISPYVLIGATVLALVVMWHRQYASDAFAALSSGPWPDPP